VSASALRDRKAQTRAKDAEELKAFVGPYRQRLYEKLRQLNDSITTDTATDIANLAHLAAIGRGLSLCSVIASLEFIPEQNKAFTLGKLHEITEALGGSDAAFSELHLHLPEPEE